MYMLISKHQHYVIKRVIDMMWYLNSSNCIDDNHKHTRPARLHPIWMLNVIAPLRTKKQDQILESNAFPRYFIAFECKKHGLCLSSVGCAEA